MPAIPLIIPKAFKRVLKKKPEHMQRAISECVLRLGENTRHPSLRTHPVRGQRGVFEAYVDQGNRVTFHYEAGHIVLRNNCNHDIIRQNP